MNPAEKKEPDTSQDEEAIRCRRLGHEIPFRFCRTEGMENEPCRLIRDCWWERFDIGAYLRENYPEDQVEALEKSAPPPNKVASLADLIRQAKERLGE